MADSKKTEILKTANFLKISGIGPWLRAPILLQMVKKYSPRQTIGLTLNFPAPFISSHCYTSLTFCDYLVLNMKNV